MACFVTPTPLDLPGPVVKVVFRCENIIVQLTDGAWVWRGIYDEEYFIPIPEDDLIDLPDFSLLPEWTPVNDVYIEVLNSREAGNDVMILPEPITNTRCQERDKGARDKMHRPG